MELQIELLHYFGKSKAFSGCDEIQTAIHSVELNLNKTKLNLRRGHKVVHNLTKEMNNFAGELIVLSVMINHVFLQLNCPSTTLSKIFLHFNLDFKILNNRLLITVLKTFLGKAINKRLLSDSVERVIHKSIYIIKL